MSLQIGDTFPDIKSAKQVIRIFVATNGEYYWCASQRTVDFEFELSIRRRKECQLHHLEPYTCSPATHYIAPNTNALPFLIPHHRAAVIDNPKITAKQIQSNEQTSIFESNPLSPSL
jgi:hypothetical protein